MPGALQLVGVECRCHVGVPDDERRRRQRILLELTVSADLEDAARSDDPADAPDYHGLEKAVRAAVEKGSFRLLERLAAAAADAALAFDPRLKGVAVGAMKRPAVMPRTREVWVRLSKSRRGGT
ncbi:MAG: dihydroneopterin aldolase [Elusimicrobia bacterium]|nr:dihydroneopterin aldolase [Elusimicrobiota bacterium]